MAHGLRATLIVALVAQPDAGNFQFRFPTYFMNMYRNWSSESKITATELDKDLDTLRREAENGFKERAPSGKISSTDAQRKAALDQDKHMEDMAEDERQRSAAIAEEARKQREDVLRQTEDDVKRRQEEMIKDQKWIEKQIADLRKQSQKGKEYMDALRREHEQEKQRFEEEQRAREAEQRRLREEQRKREEEQRRNSQRSFGFASRGDPRLCPLDATGKPIEEHCIEYTGPASIMCYDRHGHLNSIDFVGVCDEDGNNCQSKDAYWVGEQWRLYMLDGKWQWKYRNVTGSHVADVSCANDWRSEAAPAEQPPTKWLEAFNDGKSFLLHELQPRIMPGPTFAFIWKNIMFRDEKEVDFDDQHVGRWINSMLMVQGHGTSGKLLDSQKQKLKELAQWTVFYGLVANSRNCKR